VVGGITQADLNAIVADGAENNYAISGEYNPGSTFKLITATAALQSGIIQPDPGGEGHRRVHRAGLFGFGCGLLVP